MSVHTPNFAHLGTAKIISSDIQSDNGHIVYQLEVEFPGGKTLKLIENEIYDNNGMSTDYAGQPELNVGDEVQVIQFFGNDFGAVMV